MDKDILLNEDEIEYDKKISSYRFIDDIDFGMYKELRNEAENNPRLLEIFCKKILLNISSYSDFIIENRKDIDLFKNFNEVISDAGKEIFIYSLSKKISLEELFEKLSDTPETAVAIFSLMSPQATLNQQYEEFQKFQDKYIDKLFDLAKATNSKENMCKIWKSICNDELKLNKLNDVLTYTGIANNPEAISKIQQSIQSNKDFLYLIHPKFLDVNYINDFSVDQLKYIVSFPEFQNDLVNLSSNEFKNIINLVNREHSDNEEWKGPLNKIVENIKDKKFGDLLESNELSYDSELISVLSNENYFEVHTKEDLDSIKNKKEEATLLIKNKNQKALSEKYPEISKLDLITQKKLMICENIFGLSLDEAENLVSKFGEDINNIGNENTELFLKKYIQSLKVILNEENEKNLSQLLNHEITPKEKIKDSYTIDNMLKFTYGKKYDVANVDFDSLKQCKVKGLEGIKVLNAGTEFSMIISSIGAYRANEENDYYEGWNRPSLSSDIVSTSFIRNDMMGRANCPKLYFGFNNMSAEALELSGSVDLYSKSKSIQSDSARTPTFYTPDTQINQTGRKKYNNVNKVISSHNEMNYKRLQDGVRKQPDYIVVFGSYNTIDENQSGQKDKENRIF